MHIIYIKNFFRKVYTVIWSTLGINIVEYCKEKKIFLKVLPCVSINLFIIKVFIRNIVASVSL